MQLLVDGDLIAYRCSASVEPNLSRTDLINLPEEEILKILNEDGSEEIAILRCDRLMQELLHSTESESYACFLTGRDNFRKKVNLEYKANRKDKEPPRWLQQCRQFLIEEWNAIVSDGCEADDLLGIYQTEHTKIASLDKDLLMIPGWHYNWMHDAHTYTPPFEGIKTFYKQMLIGDVSDNIVGVRQIGKVKAAKLLDHIETEQELLEIVYDLYEEDTQRFLMNAQCLWILQKEGETWAHRVKDLTLPDQLQQEVDLMLDSMKFMTGVTLMEPTMNPQKTSGILVNGEPTDFMEIETLP